LDRAVYQINSKRNKLLFAHGVESASSDEFRLAYKDALLILEKDSEWISYKSCFNFAINLPIEDLIADIFNLNHHIDA